MVPNVHYYALCNRQIIRSLKTKGVFCLGCVYVISPFGLSFIVHLRQFENYCSYTKSLSVVFEYIAPSHSTNKSAKCILPPTAVSEPWNYEFYTNIGSFLSLLYDIKLLSDSYMCTWTVSKLLLFISAVTQLWVWW